MQKNICFIMDKFSFPIPAIAGGAIEELMDILINENEEKGEFLFYFFVPLNYNINIPVNEYKYTKIFYINRIKLSYRIIEKIIRIANFGYNRLKINKEIKTIYYRKIINELKKIDNPYLIFEGNYDSCINSFLKYVEKDKMYFHVHSQIIEKKDISKYFGNLISVSKFIEEDWKSFLLKNRMNYYILYNCVNEEKFNVKISNEERENLRIQHNIYSDDFLIFFCGRIVPEKGVMELLETIEMITNDKIKLLIVGSPNFSSEIISDYLNDVKILVNKLKDRVIFTGYIKNCELYKYYQMSDIQIIPSIREEAAGLVAIEGMLSALPIIVTKSGGLIEYVNKECAIILNKDSDLKKKLKYTIEQLFQDNEKRKHMKSESYRRSLLYTKKRYYKEFCEIFEDKI